MACPSSLRVYAFRIGPGSELLSSLQDFVDHNRLRAPFVLTCVGSLTSARLRLANATATDTNQVLDLSGHFEIVSLVGTLNPEAHLHLCLSDSGGRTVGGHVLGNLQIFTTAEVMIGDAQDLIFTRDMDPQTGFPELVVQARHQTRDYRPGQRSDQRPDQRHGPSERLPCALDADQEGKDQRLGLNQD